REPRPEEAPQQWELRKSYLRHLLCRPPREGHPRDRPAASSLLTCVLWSGRLRIRPSVIAVELLRRLPLATLAQPGRPVRFRERSVRMKPLEEKEQPHREPARHALQTTIFQRDSTWGLHRRRPQLQWLGIPHHQPPRTQ